MSAAPTAGQSISQRSGSLIFPEPPIAGAADMETLEYPKAVGAIILSEPRTSIDVTLDYQPVTREPPERLSSWTESLSSRQEFYNPGYSECLADAEQSYHSNNFGSAPSTLSKPNSAGYYILPQPYMSSSQQTGQQYYSTTPVSQETSGSGVHLLPTVTQGSSGFSSPYGEFLYETPPQIDHHSSSDTVSVPVQPSRQALYFNSTPHSHSESLNALLLPPGSPLPHYFPATLGESRLAPIASETLLYTTPIVTTSYNEGYGQHRGSFFGLSHRVVDFPTSSEIGCNNSSKGSISNTSTAQFHHHSSKKRSSSISSGAPEVEFWVSTTTSPITSPQPQKSEIPVLSENFRSPIQPVHTVSFERRKSSFQTCELEESGLDFPGCFVLVPMAEGFTASEAVLKDGAETRLVSTKKNYRRPMLDSERAAIKLNRKLGVCVRCKMFKERCRGGFPCERCRSLKVWKGICVTAHFVDKSVFSRGLYRSRAQPLLENVREWCLPGSNEPVEIIEVSSGYAPKLTFKVQRFDPFDACMLEHIIWREIKKSDFNRLPSSPYGLVDEISSGMIDAYLDAMVPLILNEIQDKEDKPIHSHTMIAAYHYGKTSKDGGVLISQVLRIWAAQYVFFRGQWRITGENKLGMATITDPNSAFYGITPLPRLANQQLDSLVEKRVAELELRVLTDVQTRIFKRLPTEWFTIYLTLFAFLSSLERDTWGLYTWEIDSHSLLRQVKTLNLQNPTEAEKAWTWPLKENPASLIQKNQHLAQALVAHFRSVTKGVVPFTLDWSTDSVVMMAGKDDAAIEYTKNVGKWVKICDKALHSRTEARYCRDDYESLKFSFTARLLVSDDY